MPYEIMATASTPALVIYLLDVSASMGQPLGGRRRTDVVMDALTAALRQMVFRSTEGGRLSPRYRIGMLAYSDQVYDLLDGVKPVDHVAQLGVPDLNPICGTDTALAFDQAEILLRNEMPGLQYCPSPLICQMTDGEFTGADPEPTVRRIMQLVVPDGAMLVENIFTSDTISDTLLTSEIGDVTQWPGIRPETPLANEYGRKLQALSTPLPESYRVTMLESNYRLAQGALMLLPGMSPELVAMGFQMSAATPVR